MHVVIDAAYKLFYLIDKHELEIRDQGNMKVVTYKWSHEDRHVRTRYSRRVVEYFSALKQQD
jgi:hypothetical protein